MWKSNIEKDTQTQYVAERGLRQYNTYSQREYVCHRSYQPVLRGPDRKRTLKSVGTNKIGAACPSRMIVKFMDSKTVIVNFVRCHIGHTADIIRMSLPREQRAEIAGKYISSYISLFRRINHFLEHTYLPHYLYIFIYLFQL